MLWPIVSTWVPGRAIVAVLGEPEVNVTTGRESVTERPTVSVDDATVMLARSLNVCHAVPGPDHAAML